ncbi:MAG TPA: enoyl-CoA hydratase-related protein [Pseudonocardiaceae bacterium]
MGEFVRLEVDGGIGTIRLDRPPMNALNTQVQEEIRACAHEAARRDDVRAVIVYGGEKVFAAGADIKEMAEMSYTDMAARAGALSSAFSSVAEIPKPTVAAITGYALGGGFELALCCDRRIAGDNAKVGQPEILLGIIPGAGGTQRLARLIGPSKAKDLIYTGRFVPAKEALELGMVDEVVPADQVYEAARSWAGQFVNGPKQALAAAKAAIDGGLDTDLASGLKLESHLFAALFATEDQKAGMRSFIENGPGKATFTGR